MPMSKNYYETLGITKTATKDEIKKAFRVLAHKYHPDKKDGNADKFKEVNEAYSVLSDDQKRSQYDQFGSAGPGGFQGGAGGAGFGGFNPGDFGFDFSGFNQGQGGSYEFDLGDIFGEMFGGGGGRQRSRQKRGDDLSTTVELQFEEAVFGAKKNIRINHNAACKHCSGTGGEPGTDVQTCQTCKGAGRVQEVRRSIFGAVQTTVECSTCHGRGSIPKTPCKTCSGKGTRNSTDEITVTVPPGVEEGTTLRLSGMGDAMAGGQAGDLYIRVKVRPHPVFRREENNLLMDLHIKLSTAILGAEQSIKTLDGDISLKIPEGVRHGEVLRVRGKGIPSERGKRGDLLVTIVVEMPKKLSRSARALIDELKKEGM